MDEEMNEKELEYCPACGCDLVAAGLPSPEYGRQLNGCQVCITHSSNYKMSIMERFEAIRISEREEMLLRAALRRARQVTEDDMHDLPEGDMLYFDAPAILCSCRRGDDYADYTIHSLCYAGNWLIFNGWRRGISDPSDEGPIMLAVQM
jgi:hypothetical protein